LGRPWLTNLPSNVDTHDPFELFSLFFTDKIMDKLVEWINKHAELYPPDKEKEHPRAWQPTCKQELWAYFAVLIHMGITIESCIEDYWKSLDTLAMKLTASNFCARLLDLAGLIGGLLSIP
jgi:hypothetical protein